MDSRTENFLAKYFNRRFNLPQMSNADANERVRKYAFGAIEPQMISAEEKQSAEASILRDMGFIKEVVSFYSPTIRLLKSFKHNVEWVVARVLGDVNFADVSLLALVQACDTSLFDFIRANRRTLAEALNEPERVDRRLSLEYLQRLWGDLRSIEYPSRFPMEERILMHLFPQLKVIQSLPEWRVGTSSGGSLEAYKSGQEEIRRVRSDALLNKRLCHPLFVDSFFQEMSPDEAVTNVTSEGYKRELTEACSLETPNLETIAEKLKRLFPIGPDKAELRELTWTWLLRIVYREKEPISGNMLLATSIAAKVLPSYDEKWRSAYAIHRYLERDLSNRPAVARIISLLDSSDVYARWCVMYALHPETMSFARLFPDQEKTQLLRAFADRMELKVNHSEDIFTDKGYWDSPFEAMLTWGQVVGKLKKQNVNVKTDPHDFLTTLLATKVDQFNAFLLVYLMHDETVPMFYEEELASFVPIDDVIKFYEGYRDKGMTERINEKLVPALEALIERRSPK